MRGRSGPVFSVFGRIIIDRAEEYLQSGLSGSIPVFFQSVTAVITIVKDKEPSYLQIVIASVHKVQIDATTRYLDEKGTIEKRPDGTTIITWHPDF